MKYNIILRRSDLSGISPETLSNAVIEFKEEQSAGYFIKERAMCYSVCTRCLYGGRNILCSVKSPASGFYCISNIDKYDVRKCIDKEIGVIYTEADEILESMIQISCLKYSIHNDDIDGKYLKWNKRHKPFILSIDDRRDAITIDFSYINSSTRIIFGFPKAKDLSLTKGVHLQLLFNEGSKLDFAIASRPKVEDNRVFLTFDLMPSDFAIMTKCALSWIRVIYPNREYIQRKNTGEWKRQEYAVKLFQEYVKVFSGAIEKCGGRISNSQQKAVSEPAVSSCYIYLMHDVKNGFHKIGISNKPAYRERTLQSEKPTIELLAAKEYPVRRIAEAFETALHKVYAEKRIRGEWFNLDENDVQNIITSLK